MYGNPGFPNKEMLPGGRAGESEYETASRSIESESPGLEFLGLNALIRLQP